MCVSVCEMLTLGISFTLAGAFDGASKNGVSYIVGGSRGWAFVGLYFVLAILVSIMVVPASQAVAQVKTARTPDRLPHGSSAHGACACACALSFSMRCVQVFPEKSKKVIRSPIVVGFADVFY